MTAGTTKQRDKVPRRHKKSEKKTQIESVLSPHNCSFIHRTTIQRTPNKLCTLNLPSPLPSLFDDTSTSLDSNPTSPKARHKRAPSDLNSITVSVDPSVVTESSHPHRHSGASIVSSPDIPSYLRIGMSCDPLIAFDLVLVATTDGRVAVYQIVDFGLDLDEDVMASERRRLLEWEEEDVEFSDINNTNEEKKSPEDSFGFDESGDANERMSRRERSRESVDPLVIVSTHNAVDEDSSKDDDTLVELQDNVYEIYSPSSTSKCMAFTNEELCNRLPLVYSLKPVSDANEQGEREKVDDDDTIAATTIFINQVTKRQSAQSDVGYVMWPSAIVLSRWLISNPRIISSKSVLELGAGCGLVGCSAALLISRMISENQKEQHNDRIEEENAVIITDVNDLVIENIVQNINLNDVSSIASVAKLDFYNQTGDNHTGKWIAGEICNSSTTTTCTDREPEREPVDIILAADIICQPSDAVAASKTIYDALKPGGVAYVVCANAEHRFGVDIFANECEKRHLAVISKDVAEMYDGELLSEDMNTAAGYIDGMMLTFFEIKKFIQ